MIRRTRDNADSSIRIHCHAIKNKRMPRVGVVIHDEYFDFQLFICQAPDVRRRSLAPGTALCVCGNTRCLSPGSVLYPATSGLVQSRLQRCYAACTHKTEHARKSSGITRAIIRWNGESGCLDLSPSTRASSPREIAFSWGTDIKSLSRFRRVHSRQHQK